jgi:hypothetical protein
MGRYKDYREPKRRGYDDDYTPQDRVAERRLETRRSPASGKNLGMHPPYRLAIHPFFDNAWLFVSVDTRH